MTRLLLTRLRQAAPMGQQAAETNFERALRAIAPEDWTIQSIEVANLRGAAAADGLRVPLRPLWTAPLAVGRLIGSIVYPANDLLHRLDLRCPPGAREVLTVQDLPALHFDDEGRLPRYAASSLRRARAVIAVSEFTAAELRALGARNVHVIPNGFDTRYAEAPLASPERLARLGIDGAFVVHAAGATRRKNLEGLADAWPRVHAERPDLSLLLAGPPHPRRETLFGGMPGAYILGRLEPLDAASLIRSAAAVVVPSIYEGFGLPALEGMALGVPVVAAARGALPEVCGSAALVVEPDGASLAEGLLRVLDDETLAARLRAAGPPHAESFTWERIAEQTYHVYEEVLA